MSFITKRERVFNELDLYDLPPRNEGKLKAYGSCTDARAWSHFSSSKTEHLTELIKRNTDVSVPAKYVPTTVIVDTLMVSKNLEISRLKRKIEEFEQMLAVYEELELDCAQKCEIAKAHAEIKAANKDLDDLCLNLDMSTFTDGLETESFETGKSRSAQYSLNTSIKSRGAESDRSCGDAWTVMSRENTMHQANQASPVTKCVCVSVEDPRIEEMQDEIIAKDAKLGAMHNTMAIMENDICEPFLIYAHIYTALEKIYGILSQNAKYRQFLNLMAAGKDTRCVNIKAKILFKLKILEKFCNALISPCAKDFNCTNATDCSCYRVDVDSNISLTYRITPEDCASTHSTKRSHLVADIMEHEEMKDIIDKESKPDKTDELEVPKFLDTATIINTENQKRIENLQECYGDLLNCYENLKHETCCLRVKCIKYDELELELQRLHCQLKEYNSLWNEKEHYRKRSEDLDSLKQQYMVLSEESSNLELKLKAESEINQIKSKTIEDLRDQIIKLNELHNSFEKDKNSLQCLLQESECKCICQEQQIKSLSTQIVKLLEDEQEKPSSEDAGHVIFLTEENETLRDQLKQCQDIEHELQNTMLLVNELESKVSEWRAEYQKANDRNKYLEDCLGHYKDENERILNDKSNAIENLREDIKSKSMEISKLANENLNLSNTHENLIKDYENQLHLSREASRELGQKLQSYDDLIKSQDDLMNTIESNKEEHMKLNSLLKRTSEENEKLRNDLNTLRNVDATNKKSLENARNEALIMEQMLAKLKYDAKQYENLKDEFERLNEEKHGLENELRKKTSEIKNAMFSIKLNSKESCELLKQSTSIKNDMAELTLSNQTYASKNESLKKELDILQEENENLKYTSMRASLLQDELVNLKKDLNELLYENAKLKHDFQNKNEELSNLEQKLQDKELDNSILNDKLELLKSECLETKDNLKYLEDENKENQRVLDALNKEKSALVEQLGNLNKLENDQLKLQSDFDRLLLEKEKLQSELEALTSELLRTQRESGELKIKTAELLAQNNELEKALATTKELLSSQSSPSGSNPYPELMDEINRMKKEKLTAQNKIRDLLDKLDESEQLMTSFQEDVNMRDHRLATMQNYVNDLEDEVRRLQDLLEHAIETGSDIQSANESVSQARKQLDAHHSKAAHNMKLELAMLQQSKSKLETQLSISKSQHEMSNKDVENYLSEIHNLNNDLQLIRNDIKDLEMYTVGESHLPSDSCQLPQILDSLHKIRNAFDSTHSKSELLHQTLEKVRLLLTKADEAKINLENEKQRIINEKEDAARDKFILEKQLNDLKNELDRQKSLIKHLENEVCNKNLIIEKINQSTETQIANLSDELQSLRDLYNNCLTKIRGLEEKLDNREAELDGKNNFMKNLIEDLTNKSKEVEKLQTEITNSKVQPIPFRDMSTQTDIPMSNICDETDLDKNSDQSWQTSFQKQKNAEPVYNMPKYKFPMTNEVKILAVEVEPTFDFDRSRYLKYKISQLSQKQLESYSFPSVVHDINSNSKSETSFNFVHNSESDSYVFQDMESDENTDDLIPIYQNPANDVYNSATIIELDNQKQNAKQANNNNFIKAEPTVNQGVNKLHSSDQDILLLYEDKNKQHKPDIKLNALDVTVPENHHGEVKFKIPLTTFLTETASLETLENKIKPNVLRITEPKSNESEAQSKKPSTKTVLSDNKVDKLKLKVSHEPENYDQKIKSTKASGLFLNETASSDTKENKAHKSNPDGSPITEPKSYDREIKSEKASVPRLTYTDSAKTKENKIDKSKPKAPHITKPSSYDSEDKSTKASTTLLTHTASSDTKENKVHKSKQNVPQITEPKSYVREIKPEKVSASLLASTDSSETKENKIDKSKPKAPHITKPNSYDGEDKSIKTSITLLTQTASSDAKENKVLRSKPNVPDITKPRSHDREIKPEKASKTFLTEIAPSENKVDELKAQVKSNDTEDKFKKESAIILIESVSLETEENKTDNLKPKLNINLQQINVLSTTTDNDSDSLDDSTQDGPYPVKYTLSDSKIISTRKITSPEHNMLRFETLPLQKPMTSNSDNIRLDSRSSMDIPSKESSFTKNNIQSDYEVHSSDKYPSTGHLVDENNAQNKTQQLLFKRVSKPTDDGDDNTSRILNKNKGKKRKTDRLKVKQQNDNQEDLSNRPLGSFSINSNTEIKATRAHHNIERINLTGVDMEPDPNIFNMSLDDINNPVIDGKDNASLIQQQNLIGLTLREDVFDPAFLKDEKNKWKISNLPSGNSDSRNDKSVDIGHQNNSRDGKKHSKYVDDHFGGSVDHFLDKSKNKKSHTNLDQANDFGKRFISNTSFDDRTESHIPEKNKSDVLRTVDRDVMAKFDNNSKEYEDMIYTLRKSLNDAEKDHKMQIETIKIQYDQNINKIINEHNQGVKNIQNIHEDTLYDIMRIHENEVENLRLISIEALRNVEKLENECTKLKSNSYKDTMTPLHEVPTSDCNFMTWKTPKKNLQPDTKVLTKTATQAFNVPPKLWVHGPCTCSLNINLSDTIRNIFEQVDVEQRKMAETTYLKHISNKIANENIENLDTQELSFLHLKVCRIWKMKLTKEEALQKKIDSLEAELINRQRNAQQHLADLDRKVAVEKQRLEEVREAVCRNIPSTIHSPTPFTLHAFVDNSCFCGPSNMLAQELTDHRSAGDLTTATVQTGLSRIKKPKSGNRGGRQDTGERRDRRFYTDEPPTRLRRQHDRAPQRPARK